MEKSLIHYSSFINCVSILTSKQVYFGNVFYSNDRFEKSNVSDVMDDGYFVFCTTTRDFDALMWLAYAKSEYGSAIKFIFKKGADFNDLFKSKDYKIESFEVNYTKDYYVEIGDDLDLLGKKKDIRFQGESEYRFLIHLSNNDEKKYNRNIPIDFNFDCLSKIELIINPKLKTIADFVVEKIKNLLPVQINFVME